MGSGDAPVPGKSVAPANTPALIQSGLVAQGMDQAGNFAPGRPLQPYFGYSTPARGTDFPVGVNIATQGRAAWNRVSFDVIKAIIDAYDVARICIDHKIDELRSMPLMFQPADGVKGDVDDAIEAAKLVLSYPDRELPYEAWLGKWLENYLKYDNAPLYKRRDGNGEIIGLEVVDGKTVHPYIDGNGRRPEPPAPMAWQVVHGLVGTWFTRDDLIYVPFRAQEDSPYGLAPIESALLTANTDIRAQWHFLQMFTDGSVPAGFMELPPDVSQAEQVREWQDHWDAMVMGDQAKLHQLLAVPNGSKFTGTKPAAFDKEFPNHLMRRMCAKFGVVAQDANLTDDVNRATGETQTDIQFRVNTLPWVLFVQGILTRYLQRDIGLPVKVSLDTGRDKEDRLQEAQAHKLYVDMGAESVDEVRVDVLGKPIDKERPTPRFYATPRLGPVTLLAIEGAAGKTDPETYGPAKDQLVLDQPYVPPISVVPTPGTTDDKASLAAIDAYQVSTRRALESQQDPHRESEAQREERGAKQPPPGTGDAPLRPAPQGSRAQQQAAGTQTEPEKDRPVAKAADLTGAEAADLAAFRTYVTGCKRRGRWTRDFAFTAVAPHIATELNRGGRCEVAAVLKAKAQDAPAKGDGDDLAREVYDQLSEDFPRDAIAWVLGQHWTREDLPLDQIDWSGMQSWRAGREPEKVAKLARKMAKGKADKRAIAVERPGKPTAMLADGHHHALAHRARHEPVPAYVAHPAKVNGPWDEMHSRQYPDAAVMKAATLTKTAAHYRDPSGKPGKHCGNCSMFRLHAPDFETGACTLVQGIIDPAAVCDHWEARTGTRVAKADGPVAAGIAVQAADTGRVLMLQRGMDGNDPAGGTWEFPGGCLDPGEQPTDAARREWEEETGCVLPVGEQTGSWDSSNGVYAGYVWTIPSEDAIRIDDPRDRVINPDDPGRDHVEAIAWWDPEQLLSNPAVRRELAADMPRVRQALAANVTKADGNPKDQAPPQGPESATQWPGWQYDLAAAAYWTPLIAAALGAGIDADALAHAFLAGHTRSAAPDGESEQEREQRLRVAAAGWLEHYRGALQAELRTVLPGILTDGYAIGAAASAALMDAAEAGRPLTDLAADMAGWHPGAYEAAMLLISRDADGSGLRALLDQAQVVIKSIADSRLDDLGFRLAVSAARGDSADTIAADIRDLLTAPWRAHMVAATELARAVSAAAVDGYQRRGYRETEWLTAEDQHVCPEICELNADRGPVPIGEPFPSGAFAPPGHPECRCAPGCVISSRSEGGE